MRIPTVMMRGGTSKALFFHEADLPPVGAARDRFILSAYGSPDPYGRQIDGVGGATSSSSKVAIISKSTDAAADLDYEFGQVGIAENRIDRHGNCGNISSAVGPFAVDEGLVEATDPVTIVRFRNTNTGKIIVAHVPTARGRFQPRGDFELSGVPGTGSKIVVDYLNPGGAVTGLLLPTGHVVDRIEAPSFGAVMATMIDAANPFVFIRPADIGIDPSDAVERLRDDTDVARILEDIRTRAAVMIGMAANPDEAHELSPAFPKVAVVLPRSDYRTVDGSVVEASAYTVRAAMMSMGTLHGSYPLTGAIATAVAARLPGTLVHESASTAVGSDVVIGHPAGLFPLSVDVRADAVDPADWEVERVSCFRTARRLMEGFVFADE